MPLLLRSRIYNDVIQALETIPSIVQDTTVLQKSFQMLVDMMLLGEAVEGIQMDLPICDMSVD